MGAMGTVHSERGLTYYEVVLAGHMVPQFSPVVRIAPPLIPAHPADLLYSSVHFFETGVVSDYAVPDGLPGLAVNAWIGALGAVITQLGHSGINVDMIY